MFKPSQEFKRFALCSFATIMASILLPTVVFAANGSFERTAGPQQTAAAEAFVVFANPSFNDGEVVSDSEDVLAHAEANGESSDSLSTAIAHAEFTALSPVPTGSSTFGPMVSASSFHSGLASATFEEDDGVITAGSVFTTSERQFNNAATNANYLLTFDGVAQGNFYGSLYLVGIENSVAAGPDNDTVAFAEDNTTVSSAITIGPNAFGASATYRRASDDWAVTATLPGGILINEVVATVNRHFSFTVQVSSGTPFSFTSSNSVGAVASAAAGGIPEPSNAMADIQVTTVGGAWGYATAPNAPLSGDFNGDGKVDNTDYGIWRQNVGRTIGALGPQGDANLDGAVDSDDLSIWLANTETPGIPGDYNNDEKVDAADYTIWRDTLGSTTELAADGDLNGIVNSLDYDVWTSHFGDPPITSPGSGANAVPEPNATLLLFIVASVASCMKSKRRGQLKI